MKALLPFTASKATQRHRLEHVTDLTELWLGSPLLSWCSYLWGPTLGCPSSLFLLVKSVALLSIHKASHIIVYRQLHKCLGTLECGQTRALVPKKWALLSKLFLTQLLHEELEKAHLIYLLFVACKQGL